MPEYRNVRVTADCPDCGGGELGGPINCPECRGSGRVSVPVEQIRVARSVKLSTPSQWVEPRLPEGRDGWEYRTALVLPSTGDEKGRGGRFSASHSTTSDSVEGLPGDEKP